MDKKNILIFIYMFKITKVKGGRIKLLKMLNKKIRGKGTPAVKKNYEIDEFDKEFKNMRFPEKQSNPVAKRSNRSIKPLLFKL